MKLNKKEIKNLISTLTDIYTSLENDEDVFEFNGELTNSLENSEEENDCFSVPEKWALKAYNRKNAEVIYPYLNKKFNHAWEVGNESHYKTFVYVDSTEGTSKSSYTGIDDEYVQLDPESFIKNVIMKDHEH